jgi:hypothetical protein
LNSVPNAGNAVGNSYQSMDSGVLMDDWNRWTATYNTYRTAVTSYTGLATTYNAAIKTEAIRQSNFFSSIFQAKQSNFPDLPCVPDRPAAYTGPNLQWTHTWDTIKAT